MSILLYLSLLLIITSGARAKKQAFRYQAGIASADLSQHVQQYQSTYKLISLTSYTNGGYLYFNTIWSKISGAWNAWWSLSYTQLQEKNAQFREDGKAPVFINSYMWEGNIRYNCIWAAQSNVPPTSKSIVRFSSGFPTPSGYDVVGLSCVPGNDCVAIHKQASSQIWYASYGMSQSSFIAKIDERGKDGYTVMSAQVNTDDRYSAVWVKNGLPYRYFYGSSTVSGGSIQSAIDDGFRVQVLDGRANAWLLILHKTPTLDFRAQANLPFKIPCLDSIITEFLDENSIPGASIAVQQKGYGLYTQTYGVRDVPQIDTGTSGRLVDSTTTFRMASLSKAIAAVSVVQLVEAGRLSFDHHVFRSGGVLRYLLSSARPVADSRLYDITVDMLLRHTSGWDRCISRDIMFRMNWVAGRLGVPSPPSLDQMIDFQLGEMLDHAPGTRWAYSNFGYVLLGKIVERLKGVPFPDQVPSDMYFGRTLLRDQPSQETEYFCSVCPVQAPYDPTWSNMELLFTSAQYVGTPAQYLKYFQDLSPSTVALLTARPLSGPGSSPSNTWWYARGVYATNTDSYYHDGILDGTGSAFHFGQQRSFVMFANSRVSDLKDLMWRATGCASPSQWPPAPVECPQNSFGSVGSQPRSADFELASGAHTFDFSCAATTGSHTSFTVKATRAGLYTFETTGSSFDTVLEVKAGCTGASYACNDDQATGVRTSRVTRQLSENQEVVVFIGGYSSSHSGSARLTVSPPVTPAPTPRPTSACPQYQLTDPITLVTSTTLSLAASAPIHDFSCSTSERGHHLSVLVTAGRSGVYIFDTSLTDYDTLIEIRESCSSASSLACNDDDTPNLTSRASVALQQGQTVIVFLGGFSDSGVGEMRLKVTPPATLAPTPAPTADCPAASLADITGTRTESLVLPSGPSSFDFGCSASDVGPDTSFSLTARAGSGEYIFDTSGTSFDTLLSVKAGSCSGALLGCDDDGGEGYASKLSLSLNEGQTVVLYVGGYQPRHHGAVTLSITAPSAPTCVVAKKDKRRQNPTDCFPCFGYGEDSARVDITSLSTLLASWGACAVASPCVTDSNCDGRVDIADLSEMLAKWGPLSACQC